MGELKMTFHERKQARREYYENYVKGWKLRPCSACNGSGKYDHNGSPDCGSCDGSGKERYSEVEEERSMIRHIEFNGTDEWTRNWWESYKTTQRGVEFLSTKEGQKIEEMFHS